MLDSIENARRMQEERGQVTALEVRTVDVHRKLAGQILSQQDRHIIEWQRWVPGGKYIARFDGFDQVVSVPGNDSYKVRLFVGVELRGGTESAEQELATSHSNVVLIIEVFNHDDLQMQVPLSKERWGLRTDPEVLVDLDRDIGLDEYPFHVDAYQGHLKKFEDVADLLASQKE